MNSERTGRPADRVLDAAAAACRNLAMLLLALMCALVISQVIGRNLFNTGMPWADELSRFCGVALVFLCVPILALRGQHVAVDLVPLMLPENQRRWVLLFTEIMVLVFAIIFMAALYMFLIRAWKFATPTLGIPNWVFYSPAAIGFSLLVIVTLTRIAGIVSGRPTRRSDVALP